MNLKNYMTRLVFGDKTLEVIEKSPEKLREVPGIGKKKADAIAESFILHKEFADVSMNFQKFGISSSQALKLYKAYGGDAFGVIAENPYRLADELYGFGFRRADQVAFKIGIKPVNQNRHGVCQKNRIHYQIDNKRNRGRF